MKRCMCTGCGNIIHGTTIGSQNEPSNEIAFDITSLYKKKVLEFINGINPRDYGDFDDEDKRNLIQRIESYLGNSKRYITEREIWYNLTDDLQKYIKSRNYNYMKEIGLKLEINETIYNSDKSDFAKKISESEKVEIYVQFIISNKGYKNIIIEEIYERGNDVDSKIKILSGRFHNDSKGECYKPLLYWQGKYDEKIITVLGGPRASKSTTFTAGVNFFHDKVNGVLHWDFQNVQDEQWNDFHENYYKRYISGWSVKQTKTNESIPQVSFRVDVSENDSSEKRKYICLTFLDLPGEYVNNGQMNTEMIDRYSRYFKNVDCILYCTSPEEIYQIINAEALKNAGHDQMNNNNGVAHIQNRNHIVQNIQNVGALIPQQNEKIIPVIYILGKSDNSEIIDENDIRNYELYSDNGHAQGLYFQFNGCHILDLDNMNKHSKNVLRFLNSKCKDIVDAFCDKFPVRCFLAISAYGYNPRQKTDKDSDIYDEKDLRPYDIEIPFYWIMAYWGYIDVMIKKEIETGIIKRRVEERIYCGKKGQIEGDESYNQKAINRIVDRFFNADY